MNQFPTSLYTPLTTLDLTLRLTYWNSYRSSYEVINDRNASSYSFQRCNVQINLDMNGTRIGRCAVAQISEGITKQLQVSLERL